MGMHPVPAAAMRVMNSAVVALLRSPRWGAPLARSLTLVTYTGRRSGRVVRTPVGYRRTATGLTVVVGMPGAKTWWRNFTGEGAPLTVHLEGVARPGHGVVRHQPDGGVHVEVTLDT